MAEASGSSLVPINERTAFVYIHISPFTPRNVRQLRIGSTSAMRCDATQAFDKDDICWYCMWLLQLSSHVIPTRWVNPTMLEISYTCSRLETTTNCHCKHAMNGSLRCPMSVPISQARPLFTVM